MQPRYLYALLLSVSFTMVFFACKKHNVNPSYTAKMGGVRNWRGYHKFDAVGQHYPTPVHEYTIFADTSFAITPIDDSTIKLGGEYLLYERNDSVKQIYFFGHAWEYYMYGAEGGIAYYYAKDSIVICSGDRHGTNDWWERDDIYYTY